MEIRWVTESKDVNNSYYLKQELIFCYPLYWLQEVCC